MKIRSTYSKPLILLIFITGSFYFAARYIDNDDLVLCKTFLLQDDSINKQSGLDAEEKKQIATKACEFGNKFFFECSDSSKNNPCKNNPEALKNKLNEIVNSEVGMLKAQRKIDAAYDSLKNDPFEPVKLAINSYFWKFDKSPSNLEDLKQIYLDKKNPEEIMEYLIKDFWGNDFLYSVEENNTIILQSLGADAKTGGQGDNKDIVLKFKPETAVEFVERTSTAPPKRPSEYLNK